VIIKTRSKSERQGLEGLAPQVLEELNVKGLAFAEPESDLAAQPGYCVAEEGGYAVAVPTEIPPELIDEGIAREIVHRLQTMRRSAGFEIADYIVTYYQAEPPLQKAIENLSAYIRQETLSQQLICSVPEEGCHTESHRIDGRTITLGVKKAESTPYKKA
jgi:isoleucyl-tRNA synthetase